MSTSKRCTFYCNLSNIKLGIMESQHRKITYRMKNRGMYWSEKGANTLSQMILLERKDELEELFLGSWRTHYELYKPQSFSIGRADKKIKDTRSNIRQYKPSYKHGRWLLTHHR